MSFFGGLIFTNVGRNLQAKAQAGAALNFTRIAIGDGALGGSSISDLTALKNQTKTMSITKLKTMTGGKAVVGTSFSNSDITSGFYWRELGVFASDPDLGEILYCYGNAGNNAEYIPAGGGADIVEKAVDCVTIVGNASSVSAVIDQSLVFASQADLNFETTARQNADTALNNLIIAKEDLIKNATTKTSMADADTIPLTDSADSSKTKKISFANLKAVLKTYFDTLYNKVIIANTLTETTTGKALDATQGKALNDIISTKLDQSSLSAEITNRQKGDTENSIAIAKTNFKLKAYQSAGVYKLSPNMWVDDLQDNSGIQSLNSYVEYDSTAKSIKAKSTASATNQGIVIMKPTISDILVPVKGFITADTIISGIGKWIKTVTPYPSDLVAYIPFDETSGNPVPAVGTFNMSASGTGIVDGYHGKGRSFNGTSDFISCSASFIPNGAKSIRFKIKKSSSNSTEVLCSTYRQGDGTNGYGILIGNGCIQYISVGSAKVNDYIVSTASPIRIDDGLPHEILITSTGDTVTNGTKIYNDGVLGISATASKSDSEITNYQAPKFGKSGDGTAYYMSADYLDELEVYKTIKTPSNFSRETVSAPIKFYLSRDGGTTYSQVTLDDFTDISTQPSGNNLVVKALLENPINEIRGIAWGVKA
jgi:hypothetical protein